MPDDKIRSMMITFESDGHYTVETVGGTVMSAILCKDETLGCIASWLYDHLNHGTRPMFLRTPEEQKHLDDLFKKLKERQNAG